MPRINKSHTTPLFEHKFEKLPKKIRNIAQRKIILFENNFRHPGLSTHKLKGPLSKFWAFSINKSYRVLFRFLSDNEVIYHDVDTHDIYK
ncbi:MAG: type II toxin-antitoxin system RelE/ParE family toxin [Patescibacteria group bacterium]